MEKISVTYAVDDVEELVVYLRDKGFDVRKR